MPKLKDALVQPDLTNMRTVPPPSAAMRPPLSIPSADPEFNPLSIAPIPPALGTSTDAARQFYRVGVSQVRMFPLPSQASQATGSQIASHVAPVADTANAASASAAAASEGVTTINAQTVAVVSGGVIVQQAIGDANDGALTPSQDNLIDGATFGRVLNTALSSNRVDPAKPGFLTKGSIPPSISSQFPYTSTTTSITWEWAGQVILRADGTTVSIPDGTEPITGLVANQSYYSYPYYDETSGTLKWLTNGDAAFTTFPGVELNGSTGLITSTTSLSEPSTFSIECWIQLAVGASANGTFAEFNGNHTGAPSTSSYGCFVGVNTLGQTVYQIGAAVGLVDTTSGVMLNDGQWHQVILTGSGTSATIYIDGQFIATSTATGGSGFTGFWRIGDGNKQGFLAGTIGRVSIFTTQLTQAQVTNHYNSMYNQGTTDYDTTLLADSPSYYWKLIETSGTAAADSAGSNTGLYTGGFTLNQTKSTIIASGSPAIAWSSPATQLFQAQNLQGRDPLSAGAMAAATPATGTGGGVSPGGGGGGCFTGSTEVKTSRGNVRFDRLVVGDQVLTAAGTYQPILEIHVHEDFEDMIYPTSGGHITERHPILHNGRWTRAKNVFEGFKPFRGTLYNLSIDSLSRSPKDIFADSLASEKSYVLADGLVAHNIQPVRGGGGGK